VSSHQQEPSPSTGSFLDGFSSLFQGAAAPETAIRLTHKNLQEAIAGALSGAKAYNLADECVRFGLAPQTAEEIDPMSGKFRYVQRRLGSQTMEQLVDLGYVVNEDYPSIELEQLLALAGMRGVAGEVRNLIFAANGPKPKLVLRDAVSNVIEITENGEYCLVYDRPLPTAGLTWRDLVAWRAQSDSLDEEAELITARELYWRLKESLDGNEAEQFLFDEYCKLYKSEGFSTAALIPQVYLHYDPYTKSSGGTLPRQRMDFLLLLPNRRRVVIELDGIQHYADSARRASPELYAQMVAEDRKLKLAGYEVYRFGGQEFVDRKRAAILLREFFTELLHRNA
jgi:hypothetical protein